MTAIYCDDNLTASQIIDTDTFTVGVYTQCACDKLPPNQDALLVNSVNPHTLVLAVADGVGSTLGHLAARAIVNALDKQLTRLPTETNDMSTLRNHVIATIEKTNHQLATDGNKKTTLTVCILHKQQYCTLQIGDSGLLHCGLRGKQKYRTITQSPVGYAVQAGLLSRAEGQQHPHNHFVDNVVGDSSMMIEIGPLNTLTRYDTLLLASDGLFDNVLDEDLINTVRAGTVAKVSQRLTQCCQQMVNPVKQAAFLKDDDISFIVCRRVK